MGMFAQINQHKGSEGGVYFLPGNYLVEVTKCKLGKDRNGVPFFVAEHKILESDNPERPAGTECSFFVKFDKDPAMGNVADFLRAALSAYAYQHGLGYFDPKMVVIGAPPNALHTPPSSDPNYNAQAADYFVEHQVCGVPNVLVGTKLKLFAFNKPTSEGNDFTRHRWSVPNAPQAQAA